MPQIGPLLWLYLMLMILVVFCLFVMLNFFFLLTYEQNSSNCLVNIESKNWNW